MTPSINRPMSLRVLAIPILAIASLALSSCEDLPSDPTPSQRIFGRWATTDSTKIAPHFRALGAQGIEMEFESEGTYTVRFSGTPHMNGTYLTRPGVFDDRERGVEMRVPTGTTGTYFGAYRIDGDTMLIEIVPNSESINGVTTPDQDKPLPNALRNGQATMEFISRLVRQP